MTRRGAPVDQRAALMEAMSLVRAGRLTEAESMIGEVLAAEPDQPDALHLLGICHHERGDPDEAEQLIRRAIRHWPDEDPQVCVAWNNLGNVLVEAARPDAALDAYRAALAVQPEASGTWTNLAGLLRRMGRRSEAEHAARQAVSVAAADPHAWFTLARVLIETGDVAGGLHAHAQGIALAPRNMIGREEVLRSLAILGHRDEAAALWGEWLQERPDDPIALHHHAACVGRAPARAADDYVTNVFDEFAGSFDAKLAKLQYRAPELVAHALEARLGATARWGTVADLGCGTGLVGALLRPHADVLRGVDLSGGMLERARRRGIYDELTQTDLVSYLRSTAAGSVDVVVAADVLCYFGELGDVLTAAAHALRPGGVIAFTVELLAPSQDTVDWSLSLTGRYAHSLRYVSAGMHGFDGVTIEPCELRTEAGVPVAGLLVVGAAPG